MENFPQSFEPVGSDSILEQFIQLKNFVNDALTQIEENVNEILDSNDFVQTKVQNLTNEQKAQARENIGAGSASINIIDNLESQSTTDALSANQGRNLNNKIVVNGNNISILQGDVSELNQKTARTLKTPMSAPNTTELVGVDNTNSQVMIEIEKFQPPVNSYIIQKTGTITPASKFIGTWSKVAENVDIPLSNISPVKPSSSDVVTGAQSRINLRYTSGAVITEQNYLMSYDGGLYNSRTTTGEAVAGLYFSNLVAESQNSLAGVDIWWRES